MYVYNNAVLSQGTNKKRSWFSINVEEPITKFIARNIFGLTPSDYVMLSDKTIVPMSESGTQFAYSERVFDSMLFCTTAFAGIFRLTQMTNVIPSTVKAAIMQQGNKLYPGVDKYTNVTLKKGTVIYRGEPNGTGFFTTKDAIVNSDYNKQRIFEGLQVRKNPQFGYRSKMTGYVLNEDINVAYGKALANPQYGKGGLPQFFVPNDKELINSGKLVPVENIDLW